MVVVVVVVIYNNRMIMEIKNNLRNEGVNLDGVIRGHL